MYPATRKKTTWFAESRQHLTQSRNGVATSRLDFGNGQINAHIEGDDRREEIWTLDLPTHAACPQTPITGEQRIARRCPSSASTSYERKADPVRFHSGSLHLRRGGWIRPGPPKRWLVRSTEANHLARITAVRVGRDQQVIGDADLLCASRLLVTLCSSLTNTVPSISAVAWNPSEKTGNTG